MNVLEGVAKGIVVTPNECVKFCPRLWRAFGCEFHSLFEREHQPKSWCKIDADYRCNFWVSESVHCCNVQCIQARPSSQQIVWFSMCLRWRWLNDRYMSTMFTSCSGRDMQATSSTLQIACFKYYLLLPLWCTAICGHVIVVEATRLFTDEVLGVHAVLRRPDALLVAHTRLLGFAVGVKSPS